MADRVFFIMANLGQISFIFIYSQFNDKFNWQIVVSGADVIFLEYHSMLHLIKVLWLAVANHMTSFNQLNCLISTYLSCATLKFAYDISSKKSKSLALMLCSGAIKSCRQHGTSQAFLEWSTWLQLRHPQFHR